MAGAGASVHQFADLASECAVRWRTHAFHCVDFEDQNPDSPPPCAASIAAEFVQTVRSVGRPPYRLIGHSVGGFVAYEMARLLGEAELAQLVIVDSYLPAKERARSPDQRESVRAFFNALAVQIPVLRDCHSDDLHAIPWEGVPNYIAQQLRRRELFMPPRDIASRLLHFHRYRGLRFDPTGKLAANNNAHLVLAAEDFPDESTGVDSDHRRCRQWFEAFDQPPTVHRVEGNHFTILRRPNVAHIAALIE
jgi:thioesterase domain-containing protein